jgi:Peptidase A4 family
VEVAGAGPGRATGGAPGWIGLARHLVHRLCGVALITAALLVGTPPASTPLHARPAASAAMSSPNWSGYAAHRPGAQFTAVRGDWAQPAVRCPQGGTYSSFWIGLDGYLSDDVEQVGTGADCIGAGVPAYYSWYELYPSPRVRLALVIRPGDRLEAQVSSVSGDTSLSLRDLTTGRVVAVTQRAPAGPLTSAEWVVEAPSACSGSSCSVLPLADFGTVPFSGCSADAAVGASGTITSASWSTDAITMVTRSGGVLAQPSDVTADGASFSVSVR